MASNPKRLFGLNSQSNCNCNAGGPVTMSAVRNWPITLHPHFGLFCYQIFNYFTTLG